MDIYLVWLLLGAIGLAGMGLLGLGSHGHAGNASGHGHAHHGHVSARDAAARGPHGTGHGGTALLQLMSPRILLAVLLGVGATGLALRPLFSGVLLAAIACAGGLALERYVVRPLWNLLMRFGSNPAMTLESAITAEATVTSTFDAQGNGIVSVEVDGHVVQLLARLRSEERSISPRPRTGELVRIEEIDAARNRCTVSRL